MLRKVWSYFSFKQAVICGKSGSTKLAYLTHMSVNAYIMLFLIAVSDLKIENARWKHQCSDYLSSMIFTFIICICYQKNVEFLSYVVPSSLPNAGMIFFAISSFWRHIFARVKTESACKMEQRSILHNYWNDGVIKNFVHILEQFILLISPAF